MIKFIKFPENIWGTPIKKRDKSSNEDFASKVRVSLCKYRANTGFSAS